MVNSVTVANEFINLARKDGRYFTPMQLLKLVYIAHGWMFGFFNKPLIDDDIEAWKYGPVIPNLYQAVKKYGNRPIDEAISLPLWERIQGQQSLDEEEQKVVKFVYKKYGHFDGIQLSMLTHQNDTPWSEVFDPYSWGDRISNNVIHRYYKNLHSELVKEYEQQYRAN